jgi:hypothetical protein
LGHFVAISRIDRAATLAGALACALAVGGCGGVEFEGKIFDYMGVSGDRQKADVRMSERPPLMVPPSLNTLPQPGTGAAVATARQDWPDDPERVRKRVVEEKEAKQAEAEAAADPINPYAGKPTLLDKLLSPKKTVTEPVADVPEPDASDRVPESSTVAQSRPTPLTPHVPQGPVPNRGDSGSDSPAPGSYGDISGGNNVGF